MILGEMHIESFRGMTDVALDCLASVSVAVGANNTGKSSLLEAAALLLRPFDPGQWVQVARLRDMDLPPVDGLWSLFPSGVSLSLEDGPKQTSPINVRGMVAGTERHFRASGLASLNWDSKISGDVTLRVEAVVNSERHTMEFRREAPAAFGEGVALHKCFTVTPATHRSNRVLVEHLSKAIDQGDKPLAVELLQLFDSGVKDLDISAGSWGENIRVTHRRRGVVDLASFGDGMRRTTALALAMVRAREGLLLVDELEAGIHPGILPEVLARLFSAAKNAAVQILATTHSLEAIDAMIEVFRESPEQVAMYYLQREGEKHSVRRYEFESLLHLRETGFDIR